MYKVISLGRDVTDWFSKFLTTLLKSADNLGPDVITVKYALLFY